MSDTLSEKERTIKVLSELHHFVDAPKLEQHAAQIEAVKSAVEQDDPQAQALAVQLMRDLHGR